jgi:hypothetical protein
VAKLPTSDYAKRPKPLCNRPSSVAQLARWPHASFADAWATAAHGRRWCIRPCGGSDPSKVVSLNAEQHRDLLEGGFILDRSGQALLDGRALTPFRGEPFQLGPANEVHDGYTAFGLR